MVSVLTFLSGIVNGIAFLEMGFTVAHMTGNMSHWGRLTLTDSGGLTFCYLVSCFCGGAALAGFNKVDGEAIFQGRESPGLISAAVAVAGGAAIRHWGGTAL